MRSIATAATAVLMAFGGIVATQTSASAGESAPLVSGTVTTAAGTAAKDAKVTVFAEPSTSESLTTGQSMTLTPLGTATTDANGAHTVSYDRSTDLTPFVDSSNQLNLTVFVERGASGATSLVQPAVSVPASSSRVGSAKASSLTRPVVKPVRTDLTLSPAASGSSAKRKAAGVEAAASSGAVERTVKVLKDYGGRTTIIGAWTSDMKDVTQVFTYSKSASSSLGVAVSSTGKAGSFTEGKTKTISSKAQVTFGKQKGKGAWRFRTVFHYQKRHYRTCGGFVCLNEYKIEPVAWWRGGTYVKSADYAYTANSCVPMSKDTIWSKQSTAAWTFSKGVSSAGMTSVKISSRTGFSSSAKQTLTFGAAGRLCGKSAYPGKSPKALRAKPK